MSVQTDAFFLPAPAGSGGQRFCLLHAAHGNVRRGLVLYIHPFAEEMNRSRRMAALQARALARAGFDVLQLDLLGCGDSSGDFGDAIWASWVSDVVHGCQWLRARSNACPTGADKPPLWLWGLRAGCLLAVQAAGQLRHERCHFLFWQPPSAGKTLLQQFLRLKLAGDLLNGQSKGVMEGLRQQLTDGVAVEIAGYRLSSELASGLERAVLAPPPGTTQTRRVAWFELSTRKEASLSPASANNIAVWQHAGFDVASRVLDGPAFWQTSEIEVVLGLIAASTDVLCATEKADALETAAA